MCYIYSGLWAQLGVFFSDYEFTAVVHTWIYLDQVIFVTNKYLYYKLNMVLFIKN